MSVSRLAHITKIGVEQMGDLANSLQDPAVLRLENRDRVSSSNVVCQTGIARGAVATAINAPNDGIAAAVTEWQRRRDLLLAKLQEFAVIPPHGGCSFLIDVSPLGLDSATAAQRLLAIGKIAATPMVNWGSATSSRYVRFVFANEPVERLQGIATRVRRALT